MSVRCQWLSTDVKGLRFVSHIGSWANSRQWLGATLEFCAIEHTKRLCARTSCHHGDLSRVACVGVCSCSFVSLMCSSKILAYLIRLSASASEGLLEEFRSSRW